MNQDKTGTSNASTTDARPHYKGTDFSQPRDLSIEFPIAGTTNLLDYSEKEVESDTTLTEEDSSEEHKPEDGTMMRMLLYFLAETRLFLKFLWGVNDELLRQEKERIDRKYKAH